ncbi:TnsA endonuclease N-terminal domain-containing protein [Lacimicrobium sp. SS2-24]|uniref:TnsA endonuclease N-terminal domain-containing protein n=1 Tax=Lacimicrobium sp. SS2-24 TaxID=2005569 RepID=UPI000B4B95FE|nr:TnsA endonuclease N-terminal domain-containing protein [Lacimicrobium sp. SS2-24]
MRNVENNTDLTRPIKRKGPVFATGYFATSKNIHRLYFESFLELSAMLHYEYDPTVDFIDSQPASFELQVGNKIVRYSPDLLIRRMPNELVYVEVKPTNKLKKKKVRNKHAALRIALKQLGREFVEFTEEDIPNTRYKNLELLHQGASSYQGAIPNVNDALVALPQECTTVGDALSSLSSSGLHQNMLHYLLFKQYFRCDLDKPLTNDSVIYSNVA